MVNENKKWRKFLQPLVTGLVAFLAALLIEISMSINYLNGSPVTLLGSSNVEATDVTLDYTGD